ncbi:class I SAM-dependent methyltransferase [Nocardioides agariphilus]|jgi:predicted O-methyltransferase YrrM|uniref:Class I SAM-dependent methyltransferase n=1 Tax=Nocardioides agariphilus TaxID=433664 RepID=A0A930VKN1_9ACTN|nr:class I SAM-dependent methyltransferase [Nocardioides agariphilus]MBF4767386.1 class I SAM-dependent methyltransferase [Nocardioides agariphilus]
MIRSYEGSSLNTRVEDEGRAAAFEAAYAWIEPVGGWLTRDQARVLFEAVRALPHNSTVVEVGSHQGRSTLALALARPDVTVVAIDPFEAGGRFGGPATRQVFEDNLSRPRVRGRVEHLALRSTQVLDAWDRPVHLVFVDGKHDVLSTLRDLQWGDRLPPGGRLLVHDGFSSIGVTLALLLHALPSPNLRYAGRVGSLAMFVRARPSGQDRLAVLAELPWFARNVGIKVLLRLRLRPIARLAGHHDRADPY